MVKYGQNDSETIEHSKIVDSFMLSPKANRNHSPKGLRIINNSLMRKNVTRPAQEELKVSESVQSFGIDKDDIAIQEFDLLPL